MEEIHNKRSWLHSMILVLACVILLSACAQPGEPDDPSLEQDETADVVDQVDESDEPESSEEPMDELDEPQTSDDADRDDYDDPQASDAPDMDEDGGKDPEAPPEPEDEEAVFRAELERLRELYDYTDHTSTAVLVNKEYGLPEGYEPDDLVKVDIPFVYQDETVHSLRKIAADAVIEMFEAAKADGLELAGVSGYRSYAIQKMLYEKYVARDGEEAANKYSAKPGHSEHSTGLAMDVAGISGKCAANNCFADTEEARWLAEHAHEFGFIIRYPLGKEDITGYQYEPWHLRYVGKELAEFIHEHDLTLEEFFLDSF